MKEKISAIEKEIRSQPISDERKEEIVEFLTLKMGNSITKRYYRKYPNHFDEEEKGQNWEIGNKVRSILEAYIRSGTEAPLAAYVYTALKRHVFKEVVLRSHSYLRSEMGMLKCPVCRYAEYLELVNPFLRIYKCSHCEDIINSQNYANSSMEHHKHNVFSFFTEDGVKCKSCDKAVPISAINMPDSWINTDYAQLIINGIEEDIYPEELMNAELKCPFCAEEFILGEAQQISLAHTLHHRKYQEIPIDNIITVDKDSNCIIPNIDAVKKSNILIEELIIKLAHLSPTTFNKCLKKYLYLAQIVWIKKYWSSAPDYFFYKTDIVGVDIHKTMFDIWIELMAANIDDLRKHKDINDISELKWFCRPPKYKTGPFDTFVTEVTDNGRIKNCSKFTDSSNWNIRMAKVISIDKIQNEERISIDLAKSHLTMTWQDIIIGQRDELEPGDTVSVSSIMMPGHPSHAPIRALLRIRSDVLDSIISRVLREEDSLRDVDFWQFRDQKVKAARKSTNINIRV